ncbi:MAG: terminase small subunit [Clostridium sp.]|uniref:terminase small subunit n=1 Tax=Clostridium TaxID=1485 RepID=UPI003EE6EFA5
MKKRIFETEESFMNKFEEYLESCEQRERLPNVAGFCFFAKIGRSSFYEQKAFFPDTFSLINSSLEDEALNNKGVAPSVLCLYLKNKCRYADKVEQVVVSENNNKNVDLSGLTFEQLKELAFNENNQSS